MYLLLLLCRLALLREPVAVPQQRVSWVRWSFLLLEDLRVLLSLSKEVEEVGGAAAEAQLRLSLYIFNMAGEVGSDL